MPCMSVQCCRVEPYWIKAAPDGAAGAPATGLCAGAPARHGRADGGHSRKSIQLIHEQALLREAIFLGFHCPARRHRV